MPVRWKTPSFMYSCRKIIRATCCVIVLAPKRWPVTMSLMTVMMMRETLRPKCCSKSASSLAMIACRSTGAMSS
ncbi:hypothetical protein D3C83_65250 [compost metagenome]